MKSVIAMFVTSLAVSGFAYGVTSEAPSRADVRGWDFSEAVYCYESGVIARSQTLTKLARRDSVADLERVDRWMENEVLTVERYYKRQNNSVVSHHVFVRTDGGWKKFQLPEEFKEYTKTVSSQGSLRGRMIDCSR